MSEKKMECDNNCSKDGCNTNDCKGQPEDFIENTHELNCINRVIAVISGKGGVGKSLVTSLMANKMNEKGYKVGILDADVTGPSIPKMFGINNKAESSSIGIYPQKTNNGINIMSINLLLDKEDSPVIWRGPIISGVIKQFWKDVIWGDIDYLFLDMPPGTGDVPLTVYQSIPLDGIIVVTSPQDLVSLIVKKAYNMAKKMNIPIIGIVENMSYLRCPECNKEINIFGKSKLDDISAELDLKILGKVPIDTKLAELCDAGKIEDLDSNYLDDAAGFIEKELEPELKFKKHDR